jgi:hypothetical protein
MLTTADWLSSSGKKARHDDMEHDRAAGELVVRDRR